MWMNRCVSLEGLGRQLGSWHVDGAERHGTAEEVLEWWRHLFTFPAERDMGNKIKKKMFLTVQKRIQSGFTERHILQIPRCTVKVCRCMFTQLLTSTTLSIPLLLLHLCPHPPLLLFPLNPPPIFWTPHPLDEVLISLETRWKQR